MWTAHELGRQLHHQRASGVEGDQRLTVVGSRDQGPPGVEAQAPRGVGACVARRTLRVEETLNFCMGMANRALSRGEALVASRPAVARFEPRSDMQIPKPNVAFQLFLSKRSRPFRKTLLSSGVEGCAPHSLMSSYTAATGLLFARCIPFPSELPKVPSLISTENRDPLHRRGFGESSA